MKHLLTGALFAMLCTTASATTIEAQLGDADGFGIGATHASGFEWSAVGGGDGDGTDTWVYGTQAVSLTYSLGGLGPITSASLEVFTGGQGLNGLTSVLIDGQLLGTLTDGDDVGPMYNYAWRNTFDLSSFLALLDGSNTLTFQTISGGDGWVLDYARFTISDDGAPVPEPGALALLAAGLIAVRLAARKQRTAQA